MPVENRVSRFDDVDLTYSSATGLAQNVTLYRHAVLHEDGARRARALRAGQHGVEAADGDRGLRWEHLNGYLPEQSSPASRFFPNLPRTFAEVARRRQLEHGRARASAPPTI